MKWERVTYDSVRGYTKYVSGEYTIKRTHSKNIFTGKEMSPQYQGYEIFRGAEKIGYKNTLKDAKRFVEEKTDVIYFDLGNIFARIEHTASGYLSTVAFLDYSEAQNVVWEQTHKTKAEAMVEILSYAEVTREDFEEATRGMFECTPTT